MTVILFLIILAVLVLVHELGHFLVAKAAGIRVDEFGLGFPPRLFGKKIGETVYSINLVPFGGFVKIFGENPDEESIAGPDAARSFVNKNRAIQAGVLVAGVTCNILFAWLLLSAGFVSGLPVSAQEPHEGLSIENVQLTVTNVLPGSPAQKVGLKAGDVIVSLKTGQETIANPNPLAVQQFIEKHQDEELTLLYSRGTKSGEVKVSPKEDPELNRKTIGIAMDEVGIVKFPLGQALIKGAATTIGIAKAITVGFFNFISQIFHGEAKLSDISGPVGIAHMVGDARELGLMYLLTFTAFISINLAVLNLMPFPALDGGRLLFVAIEAVVRRRINAKVANMVNAVGFALLILLMVVVTYRDIVKMF